MKAKKEDGLGGYIDLSLGGYIETVEALVDRILKVSYIQIFMFSYLKLIVPLPILFSWQKHSEIK